MVQFYSLHKRVNLKTDTANILTRLLLQIAPFYTPSCFYGGLVQSAKIRASQVRDMGSIPMAAPSIKDKKITKDIK